MNDLGKLCKLLNQAELLRKHRVLRLKKRLLELEIENWALQSKLLQAKKERKFVIPRM